MATAQKVNQKLWLWWTLATIAGSAMGWLVGVVFPAIVWVAPAFFGVGSVGVGVAVLQALVLPGRLRHAVWWALATSAIAVPAGFVSLEVTTATLGATQELGADSSLSLDSGRVLLIELTQFVGGFLVGACQWLVLRRCYARAGWWIPVTGLSLLVGRYAGFIVAIIAFGLLDPGSPLDSLLAFIVTAIIFGAATGYTLRRLVRSPTP